MIEAAEVGALTLEKLEAMTCVCSVGLDMIAVPGDTPAQSIAGILADEAAIGMVNNKTTAVRIIPRPANRRGTALSSGGFWAVRPSCPLKGIPARISSRAAGASPLRYIV
jgi:uncharacterized protein (UPF0210 family)